MRKEEINKEYEDASVNGSLKIVMTISLNGVGMKWSPIKIQASSLSHFVSLSSWIKDKN
jgi:hypothetical protein